MISLTKTVTVDVDVDIDVELTDFSDDDLISELYFRGFHVYEDKPDRRLAPMPDQQDWHDLADDIRATVRSGDRVHLEVLLFRLIAKAGAGPEAAPEARARMPIL